MVASSCHFETNDIGHTSSHLNDHNANKGFNFGWRKNATPITVHNILAWHVGVYYLLLILQSRVGLYGVGKTSNAPHTLALSSFPHNTCSLQPSHVKNYWGGTQNNVMTLKHSSADWTKVINRICNQLAKPRSSPHNIRSQSYIIQSCITSRFIHT